MKSLAAIALLLLGQAPDDGVQRAIDLLAQVPEEQDHYSGVGTATVEVQQADAGTFGETDGGIDYNCDAAPPAEPLDGGAWLLPPARARRVACQLAALEHHRDLLMADPPTIKMGTNTTTVLLLMLGGLGLGFVLGYALK